MAVTKLEIANSSLLQLGHPRIASFTEGSLASEVISGMYEITKRDAIANHTWRFALREKTLAPTVDAGFGGSEYPYAYSFPSDNLRLLALDEGTDFEIFGSQLYTSTDEVTMVYIADVPEAFFAAYFVKALGLQLASDICLSIDDDKPKARRVDALAARQWAIARHKDSMTSPTASLGGAVDSYLAREIHRV